LIRGCAWDLRLPAHLHNQVCNATSIISRLGVACFGRRIGAHQQRFQFSDRCHTFDSNS
jgi:hypothetical protein